MQDNDADHPRADTVVAALLYLLTHYARSGSPRLAVCIARHLQYLAVHPDASLLVRDVCASLHGTWQVAGAGAQAQSIH